MHITQKLHRISFNTITPQPVTLRIQSSSMDTKHFRACEQKVLEHHADLELQVRQCKRKLLEHFADLELQVRACEQKLLEHHAM